jgi:general secretion pathway protein D
MGHYKEGFMRSKVGLSVAVLAATLISATTALSQEPTAPSLQKIAVNFRDVELTSLAEAVSKATGKTIAVDSTIHARMNLINMKPMTPSELYKMFLSVVALNEFRAVELGEMTLVLADRSGAPRIPR